jgi:hypothetical protein
VYECWRIASDAEGDVERGWNILWPRVGGEEMAFMR